MLYKADTKINKKCLYWLKTKPVTLEIGNICMRIIQASKYVNRMNKLRLKINGLFFK